jgi:hypothetical protein
MAALSYSRKDGMGFVPKITSHQNQKLPIISFLNQFYPISFVFILHQSFISYCLLLNNNPLYNKLIIIFISVLGDIILEHVL